MSLDFSLEMETIVQPATLLSCINRLTGIPYVSENELKDDLSHLILSAYEHDDKWCIKQTEEEFGFSPFVCIAITQGKVEHQRNSELLLTAAASVLREFEGDMVLQFNGENVVMKRISGHITVNSDWYDVPEINQLNKAGLEYDVAKLTSE